MLAVDARRHLFGEASLSPSVDNGDTPSGDGCGADWWRCFLDEESSCINEEEDTSNPDDDDEGFDLCLFLCFFLLLLLLFDFCSSGVS